MSEKHVEALLNVSMFSATTSVRVGRTPVLHSAQVVMQCRVKTLNSQLQRICNGFKLHSNYITISLEGIFKKYTFPSSYQDLIIKPEFH